VELRRAIGAAPTLVAGPNRFGYYSPRRSHAARHRALVAACELNEPPESEEDQARRISAEDIGWEMDGEEPDDEL